MEHPDGQSVSSVYSHMGDSAVQLTRSVVGSAVGRGDGLREGACVEVGLVVGISVGC